MESHEEKIQDIIARVSVTCLLYRLRYPQGIFRTKKRKQKKSLNVEPSNSKCNVGNNKNVQLVKVGEAAIWVAALQATPQSLSNALKRLTLHLPAHHLQRHQRYALQLSRVAG
jgi:flagellar biogenesis protein FliO